MKRSIENSSSSGTSKRKKTLDLKSLTDEQLAVFLKVLTDEQLVEYLNTMGFKRVIIPNTLLTLEQREEISKRYWVDKNSNIFSVIKRRVMSQNKAFQVGLVTKTRKIPLRPYFLCLCTFKPETIPIDYNTFKYTVDHIDEDYKNNHIDNLQFLTRRENSKKSNLQRTITKRNRPSKPLIVTDVKDGGIKNKNGAIYNSFKSLSDDLGISISSIEKSLTRPNYYAGSIYKIEYQSTESQLLPGEYVGKASEYFKSMYGNNYRMTNFGRLINTIGGITDGSKVKRKGVYKQFGIKGVDNKHYKIEAHLLLWRYFHGEIPKGQVVRHVRSNRDADGYERNYIEDLELGTQSQNCQDYHDLDKGVRKIEVVSIPTLNPKLTIGQVFCTSSEVAKLIGVKHHYNIHSSCKFGHKTRGYGFKYAEEQ